jgi:hypothetical protein
MMDSGIMEINVKNIKLIENKQKYFYMYVYFVHLCITNVYSCLYFK